MKRWVGLAVLPVLLLLVVPLVVLMGTTAQQAVLAASCGGVADAADVVTAPVTGSTREAVTRNAAARYFPAGELAVATAVAGAESSWNPLAVNRAAGGNYGLWQVNAVHSDLLHGRDWRDPGTNAWMAFQVWDAADGTRGDRQGSWSPWSTWTSGSYKQFLHGGQVTPPVTPVTDETPQGSCAGTGGPGIVVATWNALKSNSLTNIAAGTRDLTGHSDVFGLQEMGDETRRAAAARGAVGFSMTSDHTAVPILWRTGKYNVLGQGHQLAFDAGQHVEYSPQDGQSVVGPKWVVWVHLQDRATGQGFYVLNTHMVVGAMNNDRQMRSSPRRGALYREQLATVTDLADGFRRQGATVYATCDCNVNYTPRVAPVLTMRAHGLIPSWLTLDSPATHGRRAIDYVWSTAAPASQVTGTRHGSDHAYLAVTFLPSAPEVIDSGSGSGSQATVTGTRTVTDPNTGRTFQVPIPSGPAGVAVSFALDQLGDSYVWGAHGPDAWDCSGLTAGAWKAAGVTIPAQSDAQRASVPHVPLAQARPGDILWHPGHVQVYLGVIGGKRTVVEAANPKRGVRIDTSGWMDIQAVLRPAVT